MRSVREDTSAMLEIIGVDPARLTGGDLAVTSPITGEVIAELAQHSAKDTATAIARAREAFTVWRDMPAPRRGEFVRLLGEELRTVKTELGRLVTLEAGKILSEGLGEVQEMIDICDFATGLSRQLYGLTIASERPGHRMMESWHPMGVVGIISAFNFPVAVWSWNAALALACGNAVVWKPSEKTPLTALACEAVFQRAAANFGGVPDGLLSVLVGGRDVGEALVENKDVPVLSATGSTRMGREVGPRLASRFARPILELGGNNAAIVCPSADLDLTLRGVLFSATGTAGQRCTSMRRLFLHDSLYNDFVPKLKNAYNSVPIGDPREEKTLIGPLIDRASFENMQTALDRARGLGATVHGGDRHETGDKHAYYVRPALVEIPVHEDIVREETFAPILYVLRYSELKDAIAMQNDVGAGLSSSIFTMNMREAEQFLSAAGSDCGIANVNIGTSGAEIGGAFGGEKETGGGRESGSDAWKAYMRRATNTINYSADLPLAQGVSFEV